MQPNTDVNSMFAPVQAPKLDLDSSYKEWKKSKDPRLMASMLDHLGPVIDKASYAYAGLNAGPTVKSRAKVLTVQAIRSYDPKAAANLRSWVYTQLQPLNRYSRELMPSPMPERALLQISALKKFENDFYENYGRYPSDPELADMTGMSVRQLNSVRKLNKGVVTEGSSVGKGDGDTAQDFMQAGGSNAFRDDVLHTVYSSVSPQEQFIMEHKLGFNGKLVLSNNEIAKRMKMSPGRVSQLSAALADKLDEYADMYSRGNA